MHEKYEFLRTLKYILIMKLFKSRIKRNGFIQIEFTNTETYRILREELAFRYEINDKKKYFYRWEDRQRLKVEFNDLGNAFREYLKENYNSLDNPESVSLEDLIEATIIKSPIYVSNSELRRVLAKDF